MRGPIAYWSKVAFCSGVRVAYPLVGEGLRVALELMHRLAHLEAHLPLGLDLGLVGIPRVHLARLQLQRLLQGTQAQLHPLGVLRGVDRRPAHPHAAALRPGTVGERGAGRGEQADDRQ